MLYTGFKILLALIFGGYFYLTIYFIYHKYQLRKFPGPPSFPVIGSCWDPGFMVIYKHFQNLRKRYGKIFQVFSFHKPVLVVADPVVARRILSDHKTFFKGEDYTKYFGYVFGKGLVTSNGEEHRKGRSILGKYFIRSSVSKFTDNIHGITTKAMDEFMESSMGSNGKGGLDFNIEEFFATLALRVFMKFAADYDTSIDKKFEHQACQDASKGSYAVSKMIILKEPYWSFMPNAKVCYKFNATFKIFFEKVVKQRQECLAKGEKFDDMLQALLDDPDTTDEDRYDHFRTAVGAGHDTTAFFMSYLVYLLARHQDIQQKLVDYLDTQLAGKDIVTVDDLSQLKYLQCVMMETLRMYPIIPVVTRECSSDAIIKEENLNVTIPKNITILIPMVVMNKDPENWDNPNDFLPSRFENKASADFTSAKDGFFPFAYGSRICIGNTLAQTESAIVMINLLRRYKIEEVEGFRPKIMAGISLTTSNGMHVRLTPRHSSNK